MDEENKIIDEKELVEETSVEEKPAVEETPIPESKPENEEIVIEKPDPNASDYGDNIEKARLDFLKSYKNSRRNSYIMMGVVFALAVASVIFITLNGMGFKIAGWSLVGAAVVGMLVYYIVTRNSLPNRTKAYIAVVNENLNSRNFSHQSITEARTDKNEKIDLTDILSDSVYKDLNNIASRNVVNGKYLGRTFKVADLGLYTGAGRNRMAAFVGKYASLPNDLHFEGRYILNIKGEKLVDLPTDLEGLVEVLNEDGLIIYGKEGSKPASDLGKQFISAIKEIKTNNILLNVNIVIWGGHSASYCSYDDVIMTLPFEKPFDRSANEIYANNLVDIFEALSLLTKKE